MVLPISVTAIGISFMLKPRRDDRPYKFFLYVQFFVFAYLGELLALVGLEPKTSAIVDASLKGLLLYPALLAFGIKSRSHIAKLTDKDLSHFLIKDVVMGGVVVGCGQLAFLAFAGIQCNNSNEDWKQCNRTLTSQTGETKP